MAMTPLETAPQTLTTANARVGDQTIKETLESIVVAFILAFVFRAFVVEAFVIPTGSMAPTLLGRHMRAIDPSTGERFAVDVPGRGHLPEPLETAGAMSRRSWTAGMGTRMNPGDRILVLKYLYSFAEPRRWDVVVFKDPGVPQQNFIKRLIGLPGEQLLLIDGNVYVKPADEPWRIARKTDHHTHDKVQRAVWQPLYHSRFVPLDLAGDDASQRQHADQGGPWSPPWRIVAGEWVGGVDDSLPAEPAYRLRSASGALTFDFATVLSRAPGLYPYNQVRGPDQAADQPVEDVRLAATVVPESDGLAVELATTARLDSADGSPQRLAATLDADGSVRLWARDVESGAQRALAGPVAATAPRVGAARRIELWMVDLEASVWINGRQVLRHRFDLPMEAARRQPPPSRHPDELSITLRGGPATLRDLEVDRDLYYMAVDGFMDYIADEQPTDAGMNTRNSRRPRPGHGVLVKDRDDRYGEPFVLEADQFYCLGDNSPMSGDSRQWSMVDPWVRAKFLADDPTPLGVVPRELMMGRAFFVYWPAPFSLSPRGPGFIPNFSDMRFIH